MYLVLLLYFTITNKVSKFKACFKWVVDPPADKTEEQKVVDFKALQRRATTNEFKAPSVGKITSWIITDFQKVEMAEDQFGVFHSGDSYIILFEYEENDVIKWIIYFWQGKDSTADEKGSSALLATELDDSLGGAPVQVRNNMYTYLKLIIERCDL